jgi:hypothetical protein
MRLFGKTACWRSRLCNLLQIPESFYEPRAWQAFGLLQYPARLTCFPSLVSRVARDPAREAINCMQEEQHELANPGATQHGDFGV